MKSLYSVSNTLTEFDIGDPNDGLTSNLDLNVFVDNMSNLVTLDIHLSRALGTITTINSSLLASTIQYFNVQRNNLNGEIDWNIFRNIKNMIIFGIFDNPSLNGSIDWDIVKRMFSNTQSNVETQFRIGGTGLSGNNANFIGLDLWWFDMGILHIVVIQVYIVKKIMVFIQLIEVSEVLVEDLIYYLNVHVYVVMVQ